MNAAALKVKFMFPILKGDTVPLHKMMDEAITTQPLLEEPLHIWRDNFLVIDCVEEVKRVHIVFNYVFSSPVGLNLSFSIKDDRVLIYIPSRENIITSIKNKVAKIQLLDDYSGKGEYIITINGKSVVFGLVL